MSGPAGDARTYSLDPATGGVSVPRLLFAFLRQRFTGTVAIGQREPAGQRTIWVRGGMPVFCDWNSTPDRLGDMLVMAGTIDAATLERALAKLSGDRRLGQILMELGALDAHARTAALREQCTRKLSRIFAADATTGEAVVTAVEHSLGKNDELGQVNVLGLLFSGVTTHFDQARIEAEMGTGLGGDLVATPALARYERQFGFDPADAAVLQALARGVTVSRLMIPGVDPVRALAIIYTLWVSQMLRLGDDAVQSIAKGATAAAAAQELGVTIGTQADDKSGREGTGSPGEARLSNKPPKPAAKPPPPKVAAKPKPAPEPEPEELEPEELEPDEPDGEFEARLAALEAKVADQANAFSLFSLQPDAGRPEVRAAWAELSKTFHPDALEGSGRSRLRARVEAVFAAMSEAYGVLSDEDARNKLRDAVEFGGDRIKANEDTSAVVRDAFEAEMLARDGDKLLRAKQWGKALELYARARELSPLDGDIEAGFHYATFRAGRGTETDAITAVAALEKLTTDQPILARAYYFTGLIQLGQGDDSRAKRNFLKASKLDPRNVDAERQLRAITIREHGPGGSKEEKKKGAFESLRGLFKKD